MKRILFGLFAVATCFSMQAATIIDANYTNGTYNSNGSFEFDGSGAQLSAPPPAVYDGFGFWTSGDPTSLAGITRSVEQTRTWGATTDGALSAAIGRVSGLRNGAILNTGYDVQLADDGRFNLSFDWTGNSTGGAWETDDDLEVALFTSSDDTLGGTLTQIWASDFFDTNSNNVFETISLTGIGSVTAASAGKDLWVVFSSGTAGAGANEELAIVDHVQLSVADPAPLQPVSIVSSKPDEGALVQSDPDGTDLLAFDAEENGSADRYAWGQTFTVPTGQTWTVDAISVEHKGNTLAHADAEIKLILFDYDQSTYLSEDWGTFTDPLSGMATTSRCTEVFAFPVSPANGDWISFNLSDGQALAEGTYGFALWLSSPTAGALELINGGTYTGGDRLRVRGDTGNTLPGGDLNFVIQQSIVSDIILQTLYDSAVESPEGTVMDVPGILHADFGTNVVNYITRGRGSNGSDVDTGIREIGGVNVLGGTARMIDDLSGTAHNDLAEALAVPNDPNGTPLPDTAGLFAEFSLMSETGDDWNLSRIQFENANTTASGSGWGIALLHDGDGNGYDTGDELGRVTGTFQAASVGQTVDIDAAEFAALQGVSNATFRFYFWEDYHSTSAFDHQFGVSKLTVRGFPADLQQTSITSSALEISLGDSVNLTVSFDTNATSAVLENDIDASAIDLIALDDGDGVVVVPVSPMVDTVYTVTAMVKGYELTDSVGVTIAEFLGTGGAASISESNGIYNITVASGDFQHDTDNGIFAAQSVLAGDFNLETRVLSMDAGVYPWAKAGLMVRASNDAQSRAAGVYFTPARGALFQSRNYEKGETTRVVEDALGSDGWVRLIRAGDALYGAASTNGEQWVSFGKQTWESMPASLITGIGVAGQHDAAVTAQVEAVVKNPVGLYNLTLVENATDLRSFFQGDVVDLDYYTDGLSIRADASASVQSVVFKIDGAPFSTDSVAPFVFDLSALSAGNHTLEVVPDGGGDSLCVEFSVIRGAATTPPNIVYIHCDDLGYGDTGFNGSQYVFTPELDKLAEAGTRCSAGYVTAPQCGPSRAGMISGMYQVRFNYDDNASHQGLPEKEVAKVAPEILKDLGYTNAMIGKWHIEQTVEKFVATIASNEVNVLPWHRGFDYTYAMDGGSCHYFPYSTTGSAWLTDRGYENRNFEVMEGTTDVNYQDLPTDTYQTVEFTTRAINFIDRNKAGPFFVYLSYNAPHTPVNPPAVDLDRNNHLPSGGTRNLAATMTRVDDEVGRLVDYLESENLLENTIIYFFSDNGGAAPDATNNDPFSGFKGDVLEGGIRVPFLVSWKGRIPENRDFHSRVLSIDYITSILNQQRRSIPDHLDGLPILEDLQGKTSVLTEAHRLTIWRSQYKSVHRGRYKKVKQPASAPGGAQDGHVDLFTNIKESAAAPALDPAIIAELDQLMDDFNAEAQNSTNQASWFDTSDTDSDGLLDAWETTTAGNLTALGAHPADADSDGLSDEQEKAAGTDPLDPDDALSVSIDASAGEIAWDTKGLRLYQLQSRTNLVSGTWNNAGDSLYGDGTGSVVDHELDIGSTPEKFYRVKLED